MQIKQRSKLFLAIISIVLVFVVGLVDYLTGYRIYLFPFYLIPVMFALRHVGVFFGVVISVFSAIVWLVSNLAAGLQYSNLFIPVWNVGIVISVYLLAVGLLALRQELEERVRERTAALTREMQERQRLEKELLEVSEREQRRIGQDLHDSICQHLTATALAGQVLEKKLADKSLPEAAAAENLVKLVEEAIDQTRALARNLHPVEMQADGLAPSLRELAATISERFKISCIFEGRQNVLLPDATANTHLYRIAQETISNAIKHGQARRIVIRFAVTDKAGTLTVTDDGIGFPEKIRNNEGMGLRTMAYRASVIGATFDIRRLPAGGTRMTCALPAAATSSENYA